MLTLEEVLSTPKKERNTLPVYSVAQEHNCVYDGETVRVWISRITGKMSVEKWNSDLGMWKETETE